MGQGPRTRGVRGTLLVIAVALAAALANAPAAGAARVPDGFYGFSSFLDPTPSELTTLRGGGLTTFRVSVNWATVQQQSGGPFDFTHYDLVIGNAARAGLQVAPLLYGSPSYISPTPNIPPLGSGSEKQQWSAFLTAFVTRYGRSGTFWKEHPEIPYLPLVDWIVWNEPNLHFFWYPKPEAGRYVELLSLTSEAIKAVDPQARIVAAGLFTEPARGAGISMEGYLRRLYRIKAFRNLTDVVALHPLTRNAEDVLDVVRGARQLMNQHHDKGTPIWVNELAWSTGGSGSKYYRTSAKGQAARLRTSYKQLLKHRRGLKLERLMWLAYRDFTGGDGTWINFTGLFRANGDPKPAWPALARIAGGTP